MGHHSTSGANASAQELRPLGPIRSENDRLTAEVDDLKRIHALSLRLTEATTLADVLHDLLRTSVALVGARLGTVQLLRPDGKLGLVGEVGFGTDIANKFSVVSLEDCSTCAVALKRRSRVIVQNLHTDSDFTEIAAALYSRGAVTAVSTPICDKTGNVLAMFSVYWLEEQKLSDRQLSTLDLCAELVGRHVERSFATEALLDRERRQSLLMLELSHRGKNLLSVVQAIAARSFQGDRTLDEARDIFNGRLHALGHTYNMLTEVSPENVSLSEVASATLESHGEQISIHGPEIFIPAKRAQTLALVFHELATNASKYGALSVSAGRVELEWRISSEDNEQFHLDWLETGGPAATVPSRRGFGSTIITSVVGSELNCIPSLEFSESGLRYRFDCEMVALKAADVAN